MSLLGIKTAIASITAPGTKIYEGDIEKGRILARKLNNYSADLVKSDPEKFGFFASLPSLLDVEGAIKEIEYAHSILKADGFTLFTSYGHGQYLGQISFQPIWASLNKLKAVVFIHPSETPTTTVNCYMPQPLIDYPQETTRATSDLVLTGARASFPDVKIILSHAGGTLPFLAQRIAGAGIMPSLKWPRGPLQILADFRSFYYDTQPCHRVFHNSRHFLNLLIIRKFCLEVMFPMVHCLRLFSSPKVLIISLMERIIKN